MIIDEETRLIMQEILEAIQDGSFAREWILENQAHRPVFNALRKKAGTSDRKGGQEYGQ